MPNSEWCYCWGVYKTIREEINTPDVFQWEWPSVEAFAKTEWKGYMFYKIFGKKVQNMNSIPPNVTQLTCEDMSTGQ
jgi:hypothetical protein